MTNPSETAGSWTDYLGQIAVRTVAETRIWASRGERKTDLFIDRSGKRSIIISLPNDAANALAAQILGDASGD